MSPTRSPSVASACWVSAPMRMTWSSSTVPGVRHTSAKMPPELTADSWYGSPISRTTAPDSAAISVSAARFSVLAIPASSTRSMSPGLICTGSADRVCPGWLGWSPRQVKVSESMVWAGAWMSSDSTLAAAAEGASPIAFRPVSCQVSATIFIEAVLPVPAGPTPAATSVPTVSRCCARACWPGFRLHPVAARWACSAASSAASVANTATGVWAASRTAVSASRTASVVNFSLLACRSIPLSCSVINCAGRVSGSGGVRGTAMLSMAYSSTAAWARFSSSSVVKR